MPVDITSVTVTFENGIKREEYGPTRKASVSLTAAVDKGEDGVVSLNYLGTLARAKVAELLGIHPPAEAAAVLDTGLEPGLNGSLPGEPQRRTRRTKAQIEADAAAAASANSAAGTQAGTAATGGATSGEDWSEAEKPLPPTSSASPASAADEWSEAAPPAPISDADMAMHCSKHAQRLGGGDKVKAAIVTFKPEGWAQPKFGVTDIAPEKRPLFVAALEALT